MTGSNVEHDSLVHFSWCSESTSSWLLYKNEYTYISLMTVQSDQVHKL